MDKNPSAGSKVKLTSTNCFCSKSIKFRYEFTRFLGDDSGYAEYQVFLWVFLLFRETKTDSNPIDRTKLYLMLFGSLDPISSLVTFSLQRFEEGVSVLQNTKFSYWLN